MACVHMGDMYVQVAHTYTCVPICAPAVDMRSPICEGICVSDCGTCGPLCDRGCKCGPEGRHESMLTRGVCEKDGLPK